MSKEATVIGFKILFNKKGELCTEYTELPQRAVNSLLDSEARKVYYEVKKRLQYLHNELETKLSGSHE